MRHLLLHVKHVWQIKKEDEFVLFFWAGGGIWTPDPEITNHVLYRWATPAFFYTILMNLKCKPSLWKASSEMVCKNNHISWIYKRFLKKNVFFLKKIFNLLKFNMFIVILTCLCISLVVFLMHQLLGQLILQRICWLCLHINHYLSI